MNDEDGRDEVHAGPGRPHEDVEFAQKAVYEEVEIATQAYEEVGGEGHRQQMGDVRTCSIQGSEAANGDHGGRGCDGSGTAGRSS